MQLSYLFFFKKIHGQVGGDMERAACSGRVGGQVAEELEQRSNSGRGRLPRAAMEVQTPLKPDVWESMLAGHPDRSLAEWASRGIR